MDAERAERVAYRRRVCVQRLGVCCDSMVSLMCSGRSLECLRYEQRSTTQEAWLEGSGNGGCDSDAEEPVLCDARSASVAVRLSSQTSDFCIEKRTRNQ